jgi:HEAT repeat protein
MRLLDVARNDVRPREVRLQALFWAAQEAGERASAEIGAIAHDDPDVEVRKQAVFALSRRDDGVVHLLSIARTSTDREVKRTAYFWLGQSRDPRATALFAEVLGRP